MKRTSTLRFAFWKCALTVGLVLPLLVHAQNNSITSDEQALVTATDAAQLQTLNGSGLAAQELTPEQQNQGSCASSGQTRYQGDPNLDLDEYGIIFQDALTSECSSSAATALLTKVNATLQAPRHMDGTLNKIVGPYQGWLEGAHVSLIFATAMVLAPQNQLTQALALTIAQVRGQYLALAPGRDIAQFAALDATCGFDGYEPDGKTKRWTLGNTCMDDYVVAASAFAWIAAYENKRGEPDNSIVDLATHAINQALTGEGVPRGQKPPYTGTNSVCIHNKTKGPDVNRGPCNANMTDLVNGAGELVSLNHGYQNPGYGLGLMSNISDAIVGLQLAKNIPDPTTNPIVLSSDEQTILSKLFGEAQDRLDSNTPVNSKIPTQLESPRFADKACYGIDTVNGTLLANQKDCWDGYNHPILYPQMFPIKKFYGVMGIEVSGNYEFDVFDVALFNHPLLQKPFPLGNGRVELFGNIGSNWYKSRPALSAGIPYEGYHEVATCQTISGWAWESNQPNTPILIDIYDSGAPVAYSWPANLFRQDLLSAGKGNGYHAFVFPFHPQTKGQHTVTVKYSGTQIGLGWTPRTFTCP